MTIEVLSNSEVSVENLPEIGDAKAIFRFAMTFNGYEHYGSLKDSGDAFRAFRDGSDKKEKSFTELRNALFFCCRSSRHMQVNDYVEYYEELYPLFLEKIENEKRT